jgi:hypothetical protein
MLIFIKNNQVLQHEERINKVKLRKVLFKINMMKKKKSNLLLNICCSCHIHRRYYLTWMKFSSRKIGLRMVWKVLEYLPLLSDWTIGPELLSGAI